MSAPSPKKGRLFAAVLSGTILLLAVLATQISSRIVISQNWQRAKLTEIFANALQDNAIFRARSLDPEAVWLRTESDVTTQIRSYIEENLASMIRLNGDEMSKDSNLAWIVRYKGKDYRHNWKDSYDQQTGAVDYTIVSSGGEVSYSGAIQPSSSFSRELSILVNPSIVPAERLNSTKGSEYTYQLVLPSGFSIRYYIPSVIKPNGGAIARNAYSFDISNLYFCMAVGTGVLLVLEMLWYWSSEKQLSLLRRLRSLKALPALILLGGAEVLLVSAIQTVCPMNADGTLSLLLQSFGMTTVQAKAGSFAAAYLLWTAFFGAAALWLLYIKSIFAEGLIRYLREDTVTASLLAAGQKELLESLSNPHNSRAAVRLLLTGIGAIVIFTGLLMIGYYSGSVSGMILAFLIGLGLMTAFVWGSARKINQSFAKVYAASEQLAKGNFSALKPEDVGFYQPLYEELINISESYQSALKEGLASQITKTQLISNVSHDLKTPVAGIQSYAELITLSDNMDDIHEYAKRLSNYSIRLSDLIADLFDVAKATSGDITLDLMDIDLAELVMQVGAEWEDQFAARRLRPVYNLRPNTILRLDPGKTVRIIENLLSNICKYSLENSRVFIDLYAQDGLYQLILKNTSKTEMTFNPEMIVERFVRGDASRHESGSGLGLAIVKSFVEVQQGTFEVRTDGDLFKACLSFAIPPKPIPNLPRSSETEPGRLPPIRPVSPVPVSFSEEPGALPEADEDSPDSRMEEESVIQDPILAASTASKEAWLAQSGANREDPLYSAQFQNSSETPALPDEAFKKAGSSRQEQPGVQDSMPKRSFEDR